MLEIFSLSDFLHSPTWFLVQFILAMTIFITLSYLWECHEARNHLQPDTLKHLPPGSSGLPLVGETLQFLTKKQKLLREKLNLHGEVYRTNLFGSPTIRVSGVEKISQIFKGEGELVESSWPTSVKKLITTNGVLLSTGDVHKLRKKAFSRSLSLEYLSSSVPVIGDVIIRTLDAWKSQGKVEIFPQIRRLTTELFLRVNIDMEMSKKDVEHFSEIMLRIQDNLFCLPINIPGFSFYKAQKAKNELKGLLQTQLEQQLSEADSCAKILRTTVKEALAEKEYTDEDSVLDSVFELIFAGNDTVSGGLFSVVYCLYKHPDVVEKVREELSQELVLSRKYDLSHAVLQRLTYTSAVVKEALRLITPVGGVYRKALKSFQMKDYIIPEGWTVIASIRDTHERDHTWNDVQEFKPERWLGDAKQGSFFTFGAGDRMCPGRFFAQLALKIFVVEFVRNVTLYFPEEFSMEYFPTPRPREKTYAIIKDYNGSAILG